MNITGSGCLDDQMAMRLYNCSGTDLPALKVDGIWFYDGPATVNVKNGAYVCTQSAVTDTSFTCNSWNTNVDIDDTNQELALFITSTGGQSTNSWTISYSTGEDKSGGDYLLGLSFLNLMITIIIVGIVILVIFTLCVLSCCCGVSLAFLRCCCPRSESQQQPLLVSQGGYQSYN